MMGIQGDNTLLRWIPSKSLNIYLTCPYPWQILTSKCLQSREDPVDDNDSITEPEDLLPDYAPGGEDDTASKVTMTSAIALVNRSVPESGCLTMCKVILRSSETILPIKKSMSLVM